MAMPHHSLGRPGPSRRDQERFWKVFRPEIHFLWVVSTILVLTMFLSRAGPAHAQNQAPLFIRIGTGGLAGVYYPTGKLIAEGLTEALKGPDGNPQYIGVAQSSGGSVANVRAVVAGEIEAGLVQADVASLAFQARGPFAGNEEARRIRAVAGLYPENFQIVTRRDANIRSVPDLRGQHISLDEAGSGTLAVMRIVLAAYGLSEQDLHPVYLKPEFTLEKLTKGELQGFVIMAGTPIKAVTSLAGLGLYLVPIAPDMAAGIHEQYPFLVPGIIPAGVYKDVPATPTIEVRALLVVSSTLDDDLVYRITAALWSEHTLDLLKGAPPRGNSFKPECALLGVSIPLHPGAERYYREKGLLEKEARSK